MNYSRTIGTFSQTLESLKIAAVFSAALTLAGPLGLELFWAPRNYQLVSDTLYRGVPR